MRKHSGKRAVLACAFLAGVWAGVGGAANAEEIATRDGLYLRYRGLTGELLSLLSVSEPIPLKPITESYPTFSIKDRSYPERSGRIAVRVRELEEEGLEIIGGSEEPAVELACQVWAEPNYLRFSLEVVDTSGDDRGVTLRFQMPVEAEGWLWWDDTATSRKIQAGRRYVRYDNEERGIFPAWWHPLGAISEEGGQGLAFAVPMDPPTLARVGYDGDFFIEFDAGLSQETKKFPGKAQFTFYLYRYGGEWGLRAALKKYYDLFPQYFVKRVTKEGLWLARTPTQVINSPEDFGITFHEASSVKTNALPLDNAMGIYTFIYDEPGRASIILPFEQREGTRAPEDRAKLSGEEFRSRYGRPSKRYVLGKLEEFAADPESPNHFSALKVLAIASRREDGDLYLTVGPRPGVGWRCLFSAAADPEMVLPGGNETRLETWRRTHLARMLSLYDGRYDGQYIDSSEYLADTLNFHKEHFAYADYPLGFSGRTGRPAIMTGMTRYEHLKAVSEETRRAGKLMMANGTPIRYGFYVALMDVLGNETWHDENYEPSKRGRPPSGGFMRLRDWRNEQGMYCRRALIYQKPFCFLLKLDGAEAISEFGMEQLVTYMDWCLFFAVYPSIGGIWDDPDPYRELFRNYVPLVRALGTAGWEPITHAWTDSEDIRVERYGYWSQGTLQFAVRNFGKETASGNMVIDADALKVGEGAVLTDAFTGKELESPREDGKIRVPVTLERARAGVIQVRPK